MKAASISRRLWIALAQGNLAIGSVLAAFLLRFEFAIPPTELPHLWTGCVLAVFPKLAGLWFFGCDRPGLRYFGMRDLKRLLAANLSGSVMFVALALAVLRGAFPRSVYILDCLIFLVTTAGMRFVIRFYYENAGSEAQHSPRKRILIYGAGDAGMTLVREIQSHAKLAYSVAGLLDDDNNKLGMNFLGVTVMGRGRDAAAVVERHRRRHDPIAEIVMAIPAASGKQMREALANCRAAGVPCKTVPTVGELLTGKVLASQIRSVHVEDLLGRQEVELDESRVRECIHGQSVLVTGGAGSIGSELCRQIATFSPDRLIVLDRSESDLYRIQLELTEKFPSLHCIPAIGDIRDEARMETLIRRHGIESIFHAAAYKHVPVMETHILEAAKNNVLGTYTVLRAALDHGVSRFLMISTDKAVNPSSIMGLTKRVAELMVSALGTPSQDSGAGFVSVRFGNVLGSNGSVVPLFRQQIAAGGPVTVTHPKMRRYFMTIPEAVRLVLQASTMGKGAEIFVLDMGEPICLVDLARNMIRLSGHEPDEDIEIRFIGLRPGEKLFEEIKLDGENIEPTYHPKIRIFKGPAPQQSAVKVWLRDLEELVYDGDEVAVLEHMHSLVPEYQGSRLQVAPVVRSLVLSGNNGNG